MGFVPTVTPVPVVHLNACPGTLRYSRERLQFSHSASPKLVSARLHRFRPRSRAALALQWDGTTPFPTDPTLANLAVRCRNSFMCVGPGLLRDSVGACEGRGRHFERLYVITNWYTVIHLARRKHSFTVASAHR